MAESEEQELKRFDQRVLAAQIAEMKETYGELYNTFEENIASHTDRISERDLSEFREFLEVLRKENVEKVKQFFAKKIEAKAESFNYYDSDCKQQFDILMSDRDALYKDLTEEFEHTKLKDERKMFLTGFTLDQHDRQKKQALAFKIWKQQHLKKKEKQRLNEFLDRRLFEKTQIKCFIAWRNYSYKTSYEAKIVKNSEQDVVVFNQTYLDIINTLKNEVNKTEMLINQKTEQKAQLAYTLSKNLMKTISSLSQEVITLNQVTALSKQQQQENIQDTQNHLAEMNQFISQKYSQIKNLKEHYVETNPQQDSLQRDSKKLNPIITFHQKTNSSQMSLDKIE